MFVGRQRELNQLERLYRTDCFQFAVIYGRRRMGKTTLIHRFVQDRETIFFTAIEASVQENLEHLSAEIASCERGGDPPPVFPTFQDALESVFELSRDRRLILVIDEYPSLERVAKGLSSVLQMLIDHYRENSHLFLILCGSAMSSMEEHILARNAPLYGRSTAQFLIRPFSFSEARTCFRSFSGEDMALIYGIAGGTPQYLLQMDDGLSVEENVKQTFLNPSSILCEEPLNLLRREVREPAVYNSILSAIARGASRLSEISARVTEDSAVYLRNLLTMGLVRKETPVGEKPGRKTIYTIADNMFRFWYRFILSNRSYIDRGMADQAWLRIAPHLSTYMDAVFEDICREFLWEQSGKGTSPAEFTDLGRWWGTDPKTRTQETLDILGSDGKDAVLFGECMWTDEHVDLDRLETLVRRSGLFRTSRAQYCLFAKRGFTNACRERAEEMGNVALVSYPDMLR